MKLRQAFATALRAARLQGEVTQEDFSLVSSRTYLSSLERGLKSPTIEKLDQLAEVLKIHPASVLIATYALQGGELDSLLRRLAQESKALVRGAESVAPLARTRKSRKT